MKGLHTAFSSLLHQVLFACDYLEHGALGGTPTLQFTLNKHTICYFVRITPFLMSMHP